MATTPHAEPDADDDGGAPDCDADDPNNSMPVSHPDHPAHAARAKKSAEHQKNDATHRPPSKKS